MIINATTTDALQEVTLLIFLLLLGLIVYAWRRLGKPRRYFLAPISVYAVTVTIYYVVVIFFHEYTTGEGRMFWSVVLRLQSAFTAMLYIVVDLRRHWGQR